MKNKTEYQIGQKFISNKNSSFYNTEGELIDVSKGDIFVINDRIEDSNHCVVSYMILFNNSDIEVRLTQIEFEEILSL